MTTKVYMTAHISSIKCFNQLGKRMAIPNTDVFNSLKHHISAKGLLTPIYIDSKSVVVEGHYRFLACESLGMDDVTVKIVKDIREVNHVDDGLPMKKW